APAELINLRVTARGPTPKPKFPRSARAKMPASKALIGRREAYFGGKGIKTPVYDGLKLANGHRLAVRASVQQPTTTITVPAIFDATLRIVAQTAYIPVIMGALPYVIRQLVETFGDDIHERDVFISNDPYRAGNNHPPDINIIKPVMAGGKLAFWAVSKGHHAD